MHRLYEDDDSKAEISLAAIEATRPMFSWPRFRPAHALREALRNGYRSNQLRDDILAGIVVGIVALPLAMALAIASGVPPQYGIYTAIVSGGLICLLGGSRTQVSGPTAAFVVILSPIAIKFGLGGLILATLLAGIMLVGFGLARMGKFIEYIPSPVTTGFTAGIAVVIAVLQLKDLLGLTVTHMPEHFPERVQALVSALPSARLSDLAIGLLTLTILFTWPKINRRLPAPLVALFLSALAAYLLAHYWPGFNVATISSRFSYTADGLQYAGIPRTPPLLALPWNLPGPDGQPIGISLALIRELLPSAFAIAILGAIESLLSAVVADGMANTKHDPDVELFAQGVGNIVGPFFGAFAATGAIARTATNIRSGGRSPIAAFTHAVFVLLAVLLFAPLVGYLPMASLAALLIMVAWNMSEAKHFYRMVKIAPVSDVLVLIACFSLTVLFDMVIGVSVGLVLSALLFMHWMAITSKVRVFERHHPNLQVTLPNETILYEITGPLFFGAAQRAMSALNSIGRTTKIVILYMGLVQIIDATGLVNLESVLEELKKKGVLVILAGVRKQPATALAKAGIQEAEGHLIICKNFQHALEIARERSEKIVKVSRTGELIKAIKGRTGALEKPKETKELA